MPDSIPAAYVAALHNGEPTLDAASFVAPTAVVVGDVRLGARASIWYGSVARADSAAIEIGADSNIQDGSALHADPGFPLIVGERVSVGHRVVLHGARVHDDVLVGMGSVVMNGAEIGSWSIVAAGAVVTQGMQVPAGSLVAGVPAKIIRATSEEDRAHIRANATSYTDRLGQHRAARRVPP